MKFLAGGNVTPIQTEADISVSTFKHVFSTQQS